MKVDIPVTNRSFILQNVANKKLITRSELERGIMYQQLQIQELIEGMAVELSAYVIAEKLETRKFSHSIDNFHHVPLTWWDHFKETHKGKWWNWFKKIKYKRIACLAELEVAVDFLHVFPKADPVTIPNLGRPYRMVIANENLHRSEELSTCTVLDEVKQHKSW